MEPAAKGLTSCKKSKKTAGIEETSTVSTTVSTAVSTTLSTTTTSISTEEIELTISGIKGTQNARKEQVDSIQTINNTRTEPSDPDLLPDSITEAFRLAGARKVLRMPGRLPLGKRCAMRSTVGSLASRITAKIPGQSRMPVAVPAVRHNYSQLTRSSDHSSWSTSVSSDDSLITKTDTNAAEFMEKNIEKVAKELMSSLTGGRKQVNRVEVELTRADLREALMLLLEKRGFKPEKVEQASVKLASAGRASREIEMLCGGDIGEDEGPLRLTVCIPKRSCNEACSSEYSSSSIMQQVQACIDREDPPPNELAAIEDVNESESASIPGVELQRDSTSSISEPVAVKTPIPQTMAQQPETLALSKSTISEDNLLTVTSEPKKDGRQNMLDVASLLGRSKYSMSFGSEGLWRIESLKEEGLRCQTSTSSLTPRDSMMTTKCSMIKLAFDGGSETGRNSELEGQECWLDEAGDDSSSENSEKSNCSEGKDLEAEVTETTEVKNQTLKQVQKAAAVKALGLRRQEIRDRLAMRKVPLVSCPATVVRHLSEPQFVDRKMLARKIIHDIKPVSSEMVLGGPGIQQPHL